ncbi:hypothetical protein, partial [Thalassolituus alkanivorans]|uniref:hypothetical protein n=1 Tax=Thalassolituus alkanivorans TaxID=2881055 RepID=UPI001E42B6DB
LLACKGSLWQCLQDDVKGADVTALIIPAEDFFCTTAAEFCTGFPSQISPSLAQLHRACL